MTKHEENAAREPRLPWVYAPGSLTKHLRRACKGALHIDVQVQGWGRAENKVAGVLGMRAGRRVWRREVVLRCDAVPFVHALSFTTSAGARALGLQRLGGRPLGEILFARSAYCAQRGVLRRFSKPRAGEAWRRWALFVVRGHPLLLFEDFLPGLPAKRRVVM